MNKNFLKYYMVVAYFYSTVVLFAQPGTEDTGGTGSLEGADPAAPIDDYIWVLVLIGLFYAFINFRAIQNKRIQS